MPGLHFEMMERVDQGPRVHEKDFDMAIFPKVKQLADKYEIEFNPAHIIPDEDAMADRLFAAGMELAVDMGLWVLDTEKVVHFTEPEIWRCLENYHSPLVLGYGKDQVILQPRKPESNVRALVIGGAAGSSITEGEVYTKHMMNFALEPTNDMIVNGDRIKVFAERDPSQLPWGDMDVDLVHESRSTEWMGAGGSQEAGYR